MYKEVSTFEKSTSFSYECLLDFNNEETAAANRWSEVQNKKKLGIGYVAKETVDTKKREAR